jgi:DNA replication ATP-dependent helicase Dna2
LTDISGKSNQYEAKLVVQIVQFFRQYYDDKPMELTMKEIGIITPYRAQITCIREHLAQAGYDSTDITVDTVERYQGSARTVIIYSPCLNYSRQLNTLISEDRRGVDRKLNVAITRARSHFIMVGNPDLLKKSTHYLQLMKYSGFTL